MQAVAELALAHGAQRAERLAVAVPSHCELFDEQARRLACAVEQVELNRPRLTYVSSSQARALFDGARIGADLAANMARPVLWADTVRHAWERGARLALEMPTGSVLTRLTEPGFVDGTALACDGKRIDYLVTLVVESP
jgi:malonate decarboxylase epsilon subunit